MKIFRTTQYRGDKVWTQRYCTSRRQWAVFKQDLRYYTKMTLEVVEIPDDMWVTEQTLTDEF